MREFWRRGLAGELTRLRRDGRAALLWSMRITVAAVASYVVATLIFPGSQPLTAPLTAMLVVQVTPVSLLASGLDRVVAVVTGVSLAVAFATVMPLEWWSLGLLIFLCITIGQVLRLRANLIEVAISGMLVLGVGALGAESAGWQRIAVTLVGAAVGIAANLLFPPKVPAADAARAIDGLADSVGELLSRAADELESAVAEHRAVAPVAASWLGEARGITHHDVPRVGATLLRAEQGRRLNVRAVGTPDVGPGLRQGIEVLEHCSVAVRSMFRAILDATSDAAWLEEDVAEDVLLGLVQTLRELAAGVDAFGALVRAEASPARTVGPAEVRALGAALDGLQEARVRLENLLSTDTDPVLLELHAAVLSTVKRLIQEMDFGPRVRRQIQMRRSTRPRPAPLRPPRPRPRRTGPPLVAGAVADDVTDDAPDAAAEAETQVMPQLSDEEVEDER